MFTISEILELGMKLEKNGEAFYREAVRSLPDPSLKPLLEWLIDEEMKHQKWFNRKKDALMSGAEEFSMGEGADFLQDIMGDQSFSLKEADLSKIQGVNDLLELALEFEKDSILFYEMIKSLIIDDKTLGQLNEIIDEENHHIERLEALRVSVGIKEKGGNQRQ